MKTSKTARTIPTLTVWGDAVDSRNFAKGTDIEVVKEGGKNFSTGKIYAHNKGATPLFHYVNKHDKLSDYYNIDDTTEVDKVVKASKNGAVKVTKPATTTKADELRELARLAKKFGVKL